MSPAAQRYMATYGKINTHRQYAFFGLYWSLVINFLQICKWSIYWQKTVSSLGQNYILMGQVDEEGRGVLNPGSFTALYKTPHHRMLASINKQPCWSLRPMLAQAAFEAKTLDVMQFIRTVIRQWSKTSLDIKRYFFVIVT